MRYLLIIINLFSLTNIYAQVFKGVVVDQKTQAPLAYASIGVKGKAIGGLSNGKGEFQVNISHIDSDDTVVVSYIGFHSRIFLSQDLNLSKVNRILLASKEYNLPTVDIISSQQAVAIGNNPKRFKGFTGWKGLETLRDGISRGVLVETKGRVLHLKRFAARINHNSYDSVKFRLNIFSLNKGLPDQPLLRKNIYLVTSVSSEWVYLDLSAYNIHISEDFALALQWVEAWGKEGEEDILTLSMGGKGGVTFVQESPHGPWGAFKFKEGAPAMYIEAFLKEKINQEVNTANLDIEPIESDEDEYRDHLKKRSLIAPDSGQMPIFEARHNHLKGTQKAYKAGIEATSKLSTGWSTSNVSDIKIEFGSLIKISQPSYITDFNFHLKINSFDSLLFLFNLYQLENGVPIRPILEKGIYFKIGKEKKWIKQDLSAYQIVVEEDVVATLQLVDGLSNRNQSEHIYFTKAEQAYSVSREKGTNEWKADSDYTYSFYLNLKK